MLRVAAACAALMFAVAPQAARAEDPFSAFFHGIFGGGPRHSVERLWAPPPRERREYSYPARRYIPHSASRAQPISRAAAAHVARARQGPASGESAQKDAREKPPGTETFYVAVIGDTLAELLATGLEDALEATPQIGVRSRGKGSSGLVRDDYYDWAKAARAVAEEQPKPDVAVMMLGGNDRQPITQASETFEPLSPRWREIYAGRVAAVIAAFKNANTPVILVGLPVMKGERFSADMAQINEIDQAAAARAGAVFVDIWDKFADERGQYSAFGPNVNGEIVRLRSADGVNFTEAGARLLAHFVEPEIRRVYEAREPAEPPSASAAAPAAVEAPVAPPAAATFVPPGVEPPREAPALAKNRPAIGRIQQLTNPSSAADAELAGKSPAARDDGSLERALAKHVFVEGGEPPARRGRADDFAYPADPKGSAAP